MQKSLVYFSTGGCLLPFLIFFNLFFGWIFLQPLYWALLEAILILAFVLQARILTRKIIKNTEKKQGIVDIEAEVI